MFQQGSSHQEYTVQQPFAWLKKAILVVAIAGFIAVIWYAAANRGNIASEDLNPTLVQAPKTPIKIRPDAPGGMDVPHQDKKVFDLLKNEPKHTEPEKTKPQSTDVARADVELENVAPKPAKPSKVDEKSASELATKKPEVKLAEPAPKAKPAPTPSVESITGWGVQLGSFRSRDDAKKAVNIFNKKFGTMLEGLTPVIREAQLSQGTFYRVSFVGLENGESARNLCSAFKQRNQGCLHVHHK